MLSGLCLPQSAAGPEEVINLETNRQFRGERQT